MRIAAASKDGLWLFLPGEFNIPANAGTHTVEKRLEHESHKYDPNIWIIKSEHYEIVITKASDGIEVEVTPTESSLPEYLDMRLEEAFWFTLSLPVQWKLIEAQRNSTRRFGIRWPTFKSEQWVRTNAGSYGYGCACLRVSVNKQTHEVLEIKSSRARSLAQCRQDPTLKKWKSRLK